MRPFILKSALIIVLILAGSYLNMAFAIDENYAAPQLRGNQLRKDSFSVVADTVYFNPLLKPIQTTNSVRNLITFRIDESSLKKLPDAFEVFLELKVYYKRQSGSATVLDSTGVLYLKVDYNKNGTYNYRSIQTFTGGMEAKVVIRNVVLGGSTNLAAIEDALVLDNEIFVNREYQFSCSGNTIPSVSYDDSEKAETGELIVNWGKDRAADEYDLEWTYVDDSALADYRINPTTYNANALFNRSSTRVSITSSQYRIPLLYDTKGILFFRVRAVQVRAGGQRVEANWSSDNTAGLGQFVFGGHDGNYNWQASTSFAEEGKRKSVVQYYDGSLRNRQTITKDNTTNKTIIAENFYDYQGRPVIQVLPSPSLSSIIKYTPRFNSINNSAEYDKDLYDKEYSVNDACEAGAPPLDSASGAAQYYSASNPLAATGIHQFIPKAKGYPFTEVRYLPDNTNRISLQSGVGDTFQIGNHATRYYYGSPEQEELDALFGTEVGNSSHYFKNMVRDANGQYSISYVDMLGRTIATALAGDAPASLEKLASNKVVKVEKDLLDENNNIIKGTSIESSRSLLVPKKGDYTFKYSLVPDSLTIKDCQNLPVCYDCRYDLEITISDECGKTIRVIQKNNVALETDCGAIQAFPSVNETVNLEEGNYLITKKLTINKAAMDYYRSVFLSRNSCKSYETFLEEQKTALASLVCEPSCANCTAQLANRAQFNTNYFNALNIPQAERASRMAEADRAFDRLKRDCNALCNRMDNNQYIKEMMLADVTPPFGQYANLNKYDQFSIFAPRVYPFLPPRYLDASLGYVDEKGQPETPFYLPPDFVKQFKPSWAEALLKVHPEYPKLVKYQEIEANSNGWEMMFQETETFQEAVSKGFLNPLNFTGLPARPEFAYNAAYADPLFANISTTFKNDFKDSLDWKTGRRPGEEKISAWCLATIMAHCQSDDITCFNTYKQNAQAFNLGSDCSGELDIAWRYFREFYLQERREIIQRILDAVPFLDNVIPNRPGATYIHDLRFNFNAPDPTGPEYPQTKEEGKAQFDQAIEDNCRALSVQWLEDLKPCNLTQAQKDEIIARMIQVCKEGGDAQHIYGASTVKPSSTLADRSFEQVMKSVLGSSYNNTCNVYLINAPRAYEGQPALGEKPLYSKPDSCECATVSNFYGQYNMKRSGTETFSDYIYRTAGTRIRQGVLDTLRKACNGEFICNFLKDPISLPPVLQCGIKNVCVDCLAIDTLYDGFKREFPGVFPSREEEDSLQRSNNRLFENYMNQHLGFGKTTLDYLSFMDSCSIGYGLADTLDLLQRSFQQPSGTDCQTSFAQYFNQQRGTNYTYNQIKSLYSTAGLTLMACNNTGGTARYNTLVTWLNDYKKYGGIPHLDASGVDTTHWRPNFGGSYYTLGVPMTEIIKNGVMKLPRYYADTVRGRHSTTDFDYYDTLCFPAEGFDFEIRFRMPDSLVNPNFYKSQIWETFYPLPPAQRLQTSFAYEGASGVCATDDISFSCIPYNLPLQSFNNWRKIKWELRGKRFRYYIDTTLLVERMMKDPFTSFKFLTIAPFSQYGEIDYVRFSDVNGRFLYNEEFDDPHNLAVPDRSLKCGGCEVDFAKYFNQRNGTQLTYAAIMEEYRQYGLKMEPCSVPGPTLCGKTEPVFAPQLPVQHQPCDDSTLFAVSTATLLHEYYKDSVLSSFEDRYLAKCLEVKHTEQFTVEHNVNEYHYTLYYYDQAGNLVKTVPPEGVDLSKFQWAASWSDSVKAARNSHTLLRPVHTLVTDYRYNTLNQVVEQKSPDGGRSEFYYDRLGRLALSQNEKQRNIVPVGYSDWNYSYTKYDNLGRIAEVGEIRNLPEKEAITPDMVRDKDQLDQWFAELAGRRSQITTTLYDIPYEGISGGLEVPLISQVNLRNRVSAVFLSEGSNPTQYNQATFYTYDIHGNVNKLLQDYGLSTMVPNIMNKNGNRFKTIEYDYDLISGKVNKVSYQPGWGDQFFHRYKYDAENRLTLVETSIDGYVWEKDARYEYYLHGPLARTVLGTQQVQGLDYAYTLQGWLKGVNSTGASSEHDMGGDGKNSSLNNYVARDAYGFSLNYFTGDYQSVGNAITPFPGYSAVLGTRYKPLYNGNINSIASAIRKFSDRNTYENGPNLFFSYKYDQLNRLVSMDTDTGYNAATNSFPVLNSLPGFKERISYDANGNIQTYVRSNKGWDPAMDDLTYKYYPGTNKLRKVTDIVPANKWGVNDWDPMIDIDDQVADSNYVYDEIGNLIRDSSENIMNIKWNVYGKIEEINRVASPRNPFIKISYKYDASGNRIGKVSETSSNKYYTWYVRDAQGNIMSVYNAEGNATTLDALTLNQTERYIYGSSRLGSEYQTQGVDGGPWNAAQYYSNGLFERGRRQYELTNHLGNVLTTISDKKYGVSSNGSLIDYFEPDMVSGTEYYPFGMPMRIAGSSTGKNYRYGFNGKENDNDVKGGEGLQQDYGLRIYDPRIGRFLSVDPLTRAYPWYTPYQFAGNGPIANVDVDGAEPMPANTGTQEGQKQITKERVFRARGSYEKEKEWFWHAGSESYGTKAGWYGSEEYAEVLRPIARDLAGYQGLYNSVLSRNNWSDKQKADVANTKLGAFIMSGLTEDAEKHLTASANITASQANFSTTGTVVQSGFNVEDMLGVGLIMKAGLKALGSITTSAIKKTAGTVWDDIVATQANYPGSILPKSFELSTKEGAKVWVHGNATEHIAEFIKMKAINYTPGYVRLTTQLQLSSLQSAVNTATKNGIVYDQLMTIGGWELKFAAPRSAGQLPALIHALPK